MRQARTLLALAAVAMSVAGCSTDFSGGGLRETIGLDQRPPDEFLVVSKAPLVVPPDMNLRPPAPGAPPRNLTDPRAIARSSITGSTGSGENLPAGASAGERAILARANAEEADPTVREQLLREEGIETVDRTVADQVLLTRREEAETLDAYNEANRIRAEVPQEQASTGSDTGEPTILLEDILGGN